MQTNPLLPGNHPLRESIQEEIHTRFYEPLDPPARVSWLTLLSPREAIDRERECVADLCRRHGIEPPLNGENFVAVDLGEFRLRWERHNEFSTWAFFVVNEPRQEPFTHPAIHRVPIDWLTGLPGETIAAIHLELEPREAPVRSMRDLGELFAPHSFVGNGVSGGDGRVFTDFRVREDGFERFLVRDVDLSPRQAGRLVQRVLELETYRLMALLALPLARELMPELNELEGRLNDINDEMAGISEHFHGTDREQRLLAALSDLAADVERMGSHTATRFHAARAYASMVDKRAEELRPVRIPGLQTLCEFLGRRLDPAMRTCRSQDERLNNLATRIHRTTSMLRTRVDVAVENQNRDLLRSMNRRAHLQLRLQETVEGLSVVVISYYLTSLLAYFLRGLDDAGTLPLPVNIAIGASVPVVIGGVWYALRRMRARITARTDEEPGHSR
ncbi:DUF3422 family protein [Thioalkalivibrio sp. AKL17]|uniref:DUF3422 family protein n=1 Tax=Thioalkalivibrio sp. AKL17 TaxID=1158160 RepID=UPI00037304E8|nr:DUF3422 domain-containing protein [Thioalkalivibrio sp. AKL17]